MSDKVTDKTWVPLGLAVVTIGGVASWAATLSWFSYQHTESIGGLRLKNEQMFDAIQRIEKDVVQIKTIMEVNHGTGFRHETDFDERVPRHSSADDKSLQRRIHESRITNESNIWPTFDERPVGALEDGA